MLWLSADLSKLLSGVAFWRGSQLVATNSVEPYGGKGRFRLRDGDDCEHELGAWLRIFGSGTDLQSRAVALVVESGLGHRMKTAQILAEHRGRVLGWWDATGPGRPVHRVGSTEWRRVAREAWGVSWPSDGESCKALAVEVVAARFGRTLPPDEADAVLVGHWAIRTGLIARGFALAVKAKKTKAPRAAKAVA
jgi:hypothetical protein